MDSEQYLSRIQDKLLHSNIKFILISINWTLQGLWYSDRSERIFRILIDIVLTIFMYFALIFFINPILSIVLAFIISHTLNWLFNHHFWALMQELYGIGSNNPNKIIEYAYNLSDRAKKNESIVAVAVFGSFCRNELKNSSDLDIRLVRKEGIINGLSACLYNFFENIKAFLNKFPLDMHVIDNTNHLKKLREDEKPVIIYDKYRILEKFYNNKD